MGCYMACTDCFTYKLHSTIILRIIPLFFYLIVAYGGVNLVEDAYRNHNTRMVLVYAVMVLVCAFGCLLTLNKKEE